MKRRMKFKDKLFDLQKNIDAAIKNGNHKKSVKLIAVTKTNPFSLIQKAYKNGIRDIGENRIQEAVNKFKSFNNMPDLTRRFIGHLQTNKVNKCLELFNTVDSIDTYKLAKKIDNRAGFIEKSFKGLLEVNTSEDPRKKGFSLNEIDDMLSCISFNNLEINGLMTIGPFSRDSFQTRKAFKRLFLLKQKINDKIGYEKLTELSMGMSGDFKIAIEEGSTMVRLGTALFGERE